MAMQPYTGASSSSSMVSLKKYDVFISFRGEDTRTKFTSHLYVALSKYFVTFLDEKELDKGDEISPALTKAIEDTYVSIVVFSENYATSKWCLNELLKILERKKDHEQIVIPIFYEVDPSDVRNERGSYRQAFEKHERDLKHNKDQLQKWRNALTKAAKLSGWNSQDYRTEPDFIKDIVEDVFTKLNRKLPLDVNKEIVGIEKKYKEIELFLKNGSSDVRTLGLWGMGGIGKTTLAEYAFAKVSFQFERRCFLENVREKYNNCGPSDVRKLLLSKLFELPINSPILETPNLKKRLACVKSLIVLDDVKTSEQAKNFNRVSLGTGSRVIVTTRDKQIFSQFDKHKICDVEGLDDDDSLQLFYLHAFPPEKHDKVGYEELIERAIRYCQGNPLALEVLGANFRKKSKEVWESELEKLKKIPNREIQNVLRLSFDDLDRTQQDIFLDIACFFGSRASNIDYSHRDYLTYILDACDFFAVCGLDVLENKALITRNHDSIEMHDLLVEMGRGIVNEENCPGKRSRLWDPKEVYDVLKYNKGTDVVEVISFNIHISKIKDLYLSSDSFRSMINLRYLHINYNVKSRSKVHFPKGLEWLSDKLRYLHWEVFPLESLPSTFCPEMLVVLSMTRSKLRKLWDGIQKLGNLRMIDLDYSSDLIEIPNLSKATKLQIISLNNCESLRQLDPSVFTCPKLRKLLLSGCRKIKSLKTDIHSKSLEVLNLSNCYSLVEFSVTSEEMTSLTLSGTAIRELPSSIWCNSKLTYLNLGGCKKLNIVRKKLSTDLGLRSLTYLNLSGCTKINTSNLWFILDGTPCLYNLDLKKCCNLETLPDNIQNNSLLEILELDECSKLKSLPKLPTSLKQLTAFNCTYLDTNILHKFHFNNRINLNPHRLNLSEFCYLPGGQVPCEFDYQTRKASIDIPHIPKSGLCGFVFCIVLSEGLNFRKQRVGCTIYEHGQEILHLKELFVIENTFGKAKTLILDHVLLCSWSGDEYNEVNMGNESDHYNLSFEFKHLVPGGEYAYVDDDDEEWSSKGIKGCGVFPVYGINGVDIFELQSSDESESDESESDGVEVVELQFTFSSLQLDAGRSSSGVEIVELQSSAQVSLESEIDENVEDEYDILKLLHRRFLVELGVDESDIEELLEPVKRASFVFDLSAIVEFIHQAIGGELDVDESGIKELLPQAFEAGFDIDKSDIIELIHQAIGDEFDIDESDIVELLPEGYGAEDRDQQQIPPKEKEPILMIMKLKLEALPMKIKMNNTILIAFSFVLVITLLFLQMKMKMNINKFICRGSTDQNEKEDLDDKSCCACSIGYGVFPEYDLELRLGSRSNSRDESVFLQSNVQVSDELQHRAVGIEIEKGCDVPEFDLELSLGLGDRSSNRDENVELKSSVQVSDESDQHLKFDIEELQQRAVRVEVAEGYGVFPEYDLELRFGSRSNSRDESVFLQSNVQVSDELQHQAIGAEVGGSTNENEDDRQQLLIPPKKRRRT